MALTDSGNLLLFDPNTFALVGERVPVVPVACLGPARGNEVIVGLDDGRVVGIDVRSLKMNLLGTVMGRPVWIGIGPSGELLVARGSVPESTFGRRSPRLARLSLEGLTTGRRLWLPFVGTTFLADSRGRLWVGADRGEWGGALGVVDLAAWTVHEIKMKNGSAGGVYGLTEAAGGRVLVFGGTIHMGAGTFLAAVDTDSITMLYEVPYLKKAPVDRPRLPITNVVPLDGGQAFLVFSYGDVFEVDPTFSRWRKVQPFEAHYQAGRPDAMGTYPAIRSIQVLDESGQRLAIATMLDGWIELRKGKFVPHRLSGQIGISDVAGFLTSGGRLVARGGFYFPPQGDWVLGQNGWSRVWTASPVALPDITQAHKEPASAFFPRADGKLFAVFRDEAANEFGHGPSLLVTATCEQERCTPVDQEVSSLRPESVFVAPDESAWALDGSGLWQLRDAKWNLVVARDVIGLQFSLPPLSSVLFVSSALSPPWIVAGRSGFARLWPGDAKTAPRLASMAAPNSRLYDTIGCGGRTFTAYADGVYELVAESGRFLRLSTPGVRSPTRLGCDRESRLVLLGHGLSRLEGGEATPLHGFDASLAAWKIRALAPDAGDGLAAAIDGRGVALLPAEMASSSPPKARDEGDRPTDGPEQQAAFVALGGPEPEGLIAELDDALVAAHAGGFTGHFRKAEVGTRLVFTGPDAKRIGEILLPILARSTPAKATLYLRAGPPDTLERRIEIQPEAR